MYLMAQQDATAQPMRNLRLVIRHDCQSTGCGDMSCVLCQYNPSRLCTRNVKQKYLIDDHLKAKCGAPLRVELVDEQGSCHTEGLPPGVQLEMHVLNGEKYKELCPDNTLLSVASIKNCIITHHTKALLRREGMSDEQLRVYLPLERGAAAVSDLALTTSSEALLSGKAPTFRLLVWAVEANGEPVPYVTYVVSESFVVATKRVKHAIKADVPSVGDHVSKLLHIGKATVDKLLDLRGAFTEEGFDVKLPDQLVRVEKVGQFRQLVEMSEASNDLKNKLRHVLKLSPEKWEEVCQHALSAVVPDFRNRVWWCTPLRLGLLYQCKNGAIIMDNPMAVVKPGPAPEGPHTVMPVQSLQPNDFNALPKLKQQALANWYMPNHPNWQIYSDSATDGVDMGMPVGQALPVGPPATGGLATGAGVPGVPAGPGASPLLTGLGPLSPPNQPPFLAGTPPPGLSPYGLGMEGPYPGPGGAPMGLPGAPFPQDAAYGGGPMLGMMPPGAQGGAGQGGGHRTSSSTPFALMQQPGGGVQGGPGGNAPSPGLDANGVGGPGGGNAAGTQPSTTNSGMLVPGGLAGGVGASGGSNTSAGRSAFAANAMADLLADAFPPFSQQQGGGGGMQAGPGAPGAQQAPPGQQARQSGDHANDPNAHRHPGDGRHAPLPSGHHGGASMYMGQGALDTLRTEELMDRGMSIFGGSLTGGDAFRSTDWLPHLGPGNASLTHGMLQGPTDSQLAGTASFTMIDVNPPGGSQLGSEAELLVGAQGQGGQERGGEGQRRDGEGQGGGAGQGHQGQGGDGNIGGLDHRRLSLKLNSMSLDLDKVIAEHGGS